MKNNSAKWHKSCRLKYSKIKPLNFEQGSERSDQANENRSVEVEGNNVDLRHSVRTRNTKSAKQMNCFFCEEEDTEKNMHLPSTLTIDEKVRNAAMYLKDEKIIAKLSHGDMIAI